MTNASRAVLRPKSDNDKVSVTETSNPTKGLPFTTPTKKGHKRSRSSFMSSMKKKGGKLRRALTPPRHLQVGCAKTPVRPKTPVPLTLASKFDNADTYQIKSCENDPDPFQIEIPTHGSIQTSCKICAVLDNYVECGGVDFDFSSLMPYGGPNPDFNTILLDGVTANDENSKDEKTSSKKHPILAKLQDAASDIVVEGFYREHADDDIGRVEVCIFSSESLRQFHVVYRGSSKLQDRPIYGNQIKALTQSDDSIDDNDPASDDKAIRKETQALNDVNSTVLKAYNETNLEESVFMLLHRLTSFKPFCGVTFTGHSFGGALATVAAGKFGKMKPETRIHCHVFGSPKIGGFQFRNEIHSLPNLNVVRVERSTDPFVSLSERSEWSHVGHCLRIHPGLFDSLTTSDEARPVDIKLYRFDKFRPSSTFVKSSVNSVCNFSKLKIGNEIRSYQKDLDKVPSLKLPWPVSFEGEVSGKQISSGYLA